MCILYIKRRSLYLFNLKYDYISMNVHNMVATSPQPLEHGANTQALRQRDVSMFPKNDTTKLLAKHFNEKCKQYPHPNAIPWLHWQDSSFIPWLKRRPELPPRKCRMICQIVNASLFSKSICQQREIRVVQLVLLKCLSTCIPDLHLYKQPC